MGDTPIAVVLQDHARLTRRAIKLSSQLVCRPSITIANVESVSPTRRLSARTADVLRAQPNPEEPPSHLRPYELCVVAEGRPEEDVYEFQLKGYS
ncbi:hypothetical protein FRC05_005098, partial [Tulasnella sp. 425]